MASVKVVQIVDEGRKQLAKIANSPGSRRTYAMDVYIQLIQDADLTQPYAFEAMLAIGFTSRECLQAPIDYAARLKQNSGGGPTLYDYINDSLPLPEEFKQQFKVMGNDLEPAMGEGFLNTTKKLEKALHSYFREDTPPSPIEAWECRIGGSKFFVPPTSIAVHQQWKTGSLGGAIRQSTSVKFNSGHSETAIVMRLFFPTHETIWGFDGNTMTLNFDTDDDAIIDKYMSSLRGLVTQFKYAPFLPVKNAYLNQTFNITAVALESMTVSTVPNIPFCVQVELRMLKFNHKVFLPMIEDFDLAIHWGKFRQYVGRAGYKLAEAASKEFLLRTTDNSADPSSSSRTDIPGGSVDTGGFTPGGKDDATATFDKLFEWETGKHFDIYYPQYDPGKLIGPTLDMFASNLDPETTIPIQQQKSWWESLVESYLGVNINSSPDADFYQAQSRAGYLGTVHDQRVDSIYRSEGLLITAWLKQVNLTVFAMGPGQMEEYIQSRIKELPPGSSQAVKDQLRQRITAMWFGVMYQMLLSNPFIQNILDFQRRFSGFESIQEWEVPMTKLGIDFNKVFVQNINVTMSNRIARLQVSMQQEPTYQHIGGGDTLIQVTMRVVGEDELIKLRSVLEIIGGYARLEQRHAMLGFLGIKNTLTALCGIKYVLPMAFDVLTIDGVPHVYDVVLQLADFDVFQQKREMLSSEQQKELVDAFSKRNPFLRIQQYWGAFNAYPDFPLSVRDEAGNIIGHLDADFYFKKFETLEDDIVEWRKAHTDPNNPADHTINVDFGTLSDKGENQRVQLSGNGIALYNGNQKVIEGCVFNEPHAGNVLTAPGCDGVTPASGYVQPYLNADGLPWGGGGSGDPDPQFDAMMKDTQYRNKTGRMVRAFPTYMLWLIDEAGNSFGVKMFDNFYGLQSVIDMYLVRSEDIMADTLVLRLTNLYSRLSTPFKDLLDPEFFSAARLINTALNRARNLASGFGDNLVQLETIELKPGVRIHLRMGYSSNPNALETVFNGTIMTVEQGDIITLTCQSDAVELSAIVNNQDKQGSSGKIDGAMLSGFYMSEPRDLMVRLLSIGASTFREMVAHATQGMIFSENRFGIRHFGHILYEELTDSSGNKEKSVQKSFEEYLNGIQQPTGIAGALFGFFNMGIYDITKNLVASFAARRDFELYKRNIYPGNGLGISQYLGGDLGDGGTATGFNPVGLTEDGSFRHPITGEVIQLQSDDPSQVLGSLHDAQNDGTHADLGVGAAFGVHADGGYRSPMRQMTGSTHEFLSHIGILSRGDDDLKGWDEVSFRAQTYMKSIWDLFTLCAALLPNYIVAVRPFMDRSTIFYGKPHWLYTSGVIPLTKGWPKEKGPKIVGPDETMRNLMNQVQSQWNNKEKPDDFYNRLGEIGHLAEENVDPSKININNPKEPDPNQTTAGVSNQGTLSTGANSPAPATNNVTPPTTSTINQNNNTTSPTTTSGSTTGSSGGVSIQTRSGAATTQTAPYHITKGTWARHFLHQLGAPVTMLNVCFIAAWMTQENPSAKYHWNPMATNRKMPGSTQPSGNVRSYRTFWDGIVAEVGTLNNGHYPTILNSIKKGDPLSSLSAEQEWMTYIHDTLYNHRLTTGTADFQAGRKNLEETMRVFDPNFLCTLPLPVIQGAGSPAPSPPPPTTTPAPTPADPNPVPLPLPHDTPVTGPVAGDSEPGFDFSSGARTDVNLPGWMVTKKKQLRLPDPDPQRYALKFGWFRTEVPVNYTDQQTGLVDVVGKASQLVFKGGDRALSNAYIFEDSGRSPKDADDIWDEFRRYFPDRLNDHLGKKAYQIFSHYYPEFAPSDATLGPGETVDSLRKRETDFLHQFEVVSSTLLYLPKDSLTKAPWTDVSNEFTGLLDEVKQHPELKYYEVVARFMQFMWQHPYHRGWIVKTADIRSDLGDKISALPSDTGKLVENIPVLSTVLSKPLEWIGDGLSWGTDALKSVWDWAAGNEDKKTDPHNPPYNWELGRSEDMNFLWALAGTAGLVAGSFGLGASTSSSILLQLWETYITQGVDAARQFMITNNRPGKDTQSFIGRGIEDFKRNIADPIGDFVGNVMSGITSAFVGIVNLIRYGLMTFTYGLGLASANQQQANGMNRMLNDSIYFDVNYLKSGAFLLYLADNPFTREYGEPVVEIRQPFQRMHFINAYENIINNGTQENLSGVPTQVTAVADAKAGNHPVTVYFDKGAPSERQVEKVVETGLWWDKPGFLGSLIHPISAFRGWAKAEEGASDEISSKRVALYHLKEGLKDIYGGEILVLGDPSIRPHDMVYLADVYERMYGFFEVEQVVHQFSPDQGFITAITPNAVVTINDPARWSVWSMLRSTWSSWNLRHDMRNMWNITYKGHVTDLPQTVGVDSVGQMLQNQLQSSFQYYGGSTEIIKQLGDGFGLGFLAPVPGANPVLDAGGDLLTTVFGLVGFEFVGKHLMDQHGCIINYLTKNGRPMDAGLAYNHGVAVGHQNVITLLNNSLRLNISVNDPQDPGGSKISMNRVLANLGWNQREIDELVQQTDYWVNQTNAQILRTSNRLNDLSPFVQPEVRYVTPTRIRNGNVFDFEEQDAQGLSGCRLQGIIAPGLDTTDNPDAGLDPYGFRQNASDYLQRVLIDDQVRNLHDAKVALRVDPTNSHDRYGHLLAWVFVHVPNDLQVSGVVIPPDIPINPNDEEYRKAFRMAMAGNAAAFEWDGFFADGLPYTVNWDMVVRGHANVDRSLFTPKIPNAGVIGPP